MKYFAQLIIAINPNVRDINLNMFRAIKFVELLIIILLNCDSFQAWESFPACWQNWLDLQGEDAIVENINHIFLGLRGLSEPNINSICLFQYAELMNLPDEILGIIDEFSDARIEGLETQEDCEQLYDECPSETVVHITKKIKNLMSSWTFSSVPFLISMN